MLSFILPGQGNAENLIRKFYRAADYFIMVASKIRKKQQLVVIDVVVLD